LKMTVSQRLGDEGRLDSRKRIFYYDYIK